MIRLADATDVPAICRFGAEHLPSHYTPLIGAEAAQGQVDLWWTAEGVTTAVDKGFVVVAVESGAIVGVAERGRFGSAQVLWKLYVHPIWRGTGLGPRLIAAVIGDLPPATKRLSLEHFAGNQRASAFYEREGFVLDRVEEHSSGRPELATVWRVKTLE